MRTLALELSAGCDLRQSLEELGRVENASGFVLGIVGNLSKATFQCPGSREPTVLSGNLEIITLNGTISPDKVHLHLSFSDGDCKVWGGHLELGTLVLKGADLLIGFQYDNQVHNHNSDLTNDKNKSRLEVAVLPDCPWSARALRILRSADIPHTVLTISNDEDFKGLSQRTDMTTFPQIFLDGHLIGGYESLAELRASGRLYEIR